MLLKSLALSAAVVVAMGTSYCSAVIAPNLVGSPTPTIGGYLWTYDAQAQAGSQVASSDYFTIYDFQGYNPTDPLASISAPAGWVATSALITPAPPNTAPIDSGSVYNITFQYFGTAATGDLGNFTIFSTYGQVDSFPGIYAGQDHDLSGQPLQFIATTDTPAVPEPATVGLLSAGLAAVGLRRRRRA
jgi:hypothetical protein